MDVTDADRVEGLLHLLCEELFDDVDEVRTLACQSIDHEAGMAVPLQYLLCTLYLPQARQALLETTPAWREALERLEALLQHVDAVRAEDRRGWANLETLLHAPWPVRRPNQPDLRDWDVLLALERDGRFSGSWTRSWSGCTNRAAAKISPTSSASCNWPPSSGRVAWMCWGC